MDKTYNSKKFLEKKKRFKKIKRIIFLIFWIVLLFGFFYWMRQPVLNIEKVEIVKNHFSKTEKIRASVESVLDGDLFYLIPKTNAFILPREETQNKIKEQFPEIEKINIDLKSLKEIQIEIFEYEPKIILSAEDGKNYFVNKEGNVFMEEPFLHSFDSLLKFKYEGEIKIGNNVANPEFLTKLNSFANKLKEIDINLISFKKTEEGVYRLYADNDFEMVISEKDDFDAYFESISLILKNGVLKKEDLSSVDYIDLRFGNKVFYKLK